MSCFKNVSIKWLFDNANITWLAIYFDKTSHRIKKYVILIGLQIVFQYSECWSLERSVKMALFGTSNRWFLAFCIAKSNSVTPNFYYISKQNTCLNMICKRKIKKLSGRFKSHINDYHLSVSSLSEKKMWYLLSKDWGHHANMTIQCTVIFITIFSWKKD